MRVRRVWLAVLLAATLFVVLAGAVGFASARDEREITGVVLPMPRVGDRASYSTSAHQFDFRWAPLPYALRGATVEWVTPQSVRDANGSMVDAMVLKLRADYHYNDPAHDSATYGEYAYRMDDRTIASAVNHEEFPDEVPGFGLSGPVNMPLRAPADSRFWVRADLLQSFYGPCGFLNEHHGASLPLQGIVHLGGSCDDDRPTGDAFRYDGRDSVGGVEAFRFQNVEDPEVRVWYAPGLAFPIKVRDHFSDLLASGKTGGWVFEWTLSGFEPGTVAYPSAPRAPPTPPLLLAPVGLDRGAPDDEGVAAAIPYSAALAAATSDPNGFGDFLASPSAYIGFGWLEAEQDGAGRLDWTWYFLATDGHGWAARSVSQAPTPPPMVPDGLPTLPPGLEVAAWNLDLPNDVTGIYPELRQIAGTLPRVADAYDAFRGTAFLRGDREPERWAFAHQCWGDCERPISVLHVGVLRLAEDEDPVGPPGAAHQDLAFGPDGRMKHQLEWTETPDDPLLGDASGTAPTTAAARELAPWQPPSPGVVATVGALSILVGLAAYLWPALKVGGGLGLFSRIENDKLLDHPGRASIVQAIEAEPGIHFRELSRRTSIAAGALRHHIEKLQSANLIVAKPLNGYQVYFLPSVSRAAASQASAAARSPGARLVLASYQQGHFGVRDIAQQTGLAPSTVSHHLTKLRAAGALGPTEGEAASAA